jgi:hypothetical protein
LRGLITSGFLLAATALAAALRGLITVIGAAQLHAASCVTPQSEQRKTIVDFVRVSIFQYLHLRYALSLGGLLGSRRAHPKGLPILDKP